jgi:hypothetical protein
MSRDNIAIWTFFAVAIGAMTWFGVQFVGTGLVKKEALPLAGVITLFVFGLRWITLPAPADAASQRRALLSQRAKSALATLFTLLLAGAIFIAVQQGLRGYPELEPAGITAGKAPELDFYSVTGVPMNSASYEMSGSEGQHLLVPFDRFEGRVIVMLDHKPPATPLTATGRIRTDVRTVQRSREGQIDGPFLRLYREHLGLPQDTQIYFLDTGKRAGLNLRAIVCVLTPLYLLLLTLSAPIRRSRPLLRPKQR